MLPSASKVVSGRSEPTVTVVNPRQWFSNLEVDLKQDSIGYVKSVFPIARWIRRYNLGWLSGDVVAGLTVGMVLVPQSMSYAQIATLPSQYGLYSAFVGVFLYCFFATSKDVSIGPVAVMSLTVSQIIKELDESHPGVWSGPEIGTALSFLCGVIVLGLGLLRIGWLVEFIPAPAVSGFMTGSAINIVAGQVPHLLGVTGFDTRTVTYKVIVNTLKNLPSTTIDAAFGLPALFALYSVRAIFNNLSERYPARARTFFFLSMMRNGVILVIVTIVSWLYSSHYFSSKGTYPIAIIKTVPRGFQHFGMPDLDSNLLKALIPQLPAATVILLLEHISISKSFGRINGYKINPNQELIAIGVTNTVGTVFNAYPSTGSFSRSALNSKSGVRTPLAGWFTGAVVVVALYGLTPAFFWIPTAGLSAIIIHTVADLVSSPSHVFAFWRVSPIEFIIWLASVLVTIFATIEDGIYVSIVSSLVLLLLRVARPRGQFLGRVTVYSNSRRGGSRDVYVPLKQPNPGVLNSGIRVEPPRPGVIVYRYEESILYPNCSIMNSTIVEYVKTTTRRGKDMHNVKACDRPWNDPGTAEEEGLEPISSNAAKPLLRAIVLDFSAVSHIDTTGIQALADTRTEVEKWADRSIEFHFANILSPWIARALVAGGFGRDANPLGMVSAKHAIPCRNEETVEEAQVTVDLESRMKCKDSESSSGRTSRNLGYYGATETEMASLETPFFHLDLAAAVRAAESAVLRTEGDGQVAEVE
ncbi:high affinity sulfate permease [Rickenella mellea]|uniref:High affinity sulfate permease n=1 Tax=Rickenella mellea TaxID=50990 RepID=A0A4Y7QJP6_9AGAM|nr:high affinity sulfate permease [Rickenella mellea]